MKTWIIYIIIAAVAYFFYESRQADRDSEGAVISEGSIDAFDMHVGDCFNDEEEAADSDEVFNVPGVPCAEPHDNEVFAIFDLTLSEFPGDDEMTDMAFDSCLAYFEGFVGRDYETSALDIFPLTPTLASWTQSNDKEIICALYDLELNKLQGSVKGLGL